MSLAGASDTFDGVSAVSIPGFHIREAPRLDVILVNEHGSVDGPLDRISGLRADPMNPDSVPINIGLLVLPKHLQKRWRLIADLLIDGTDQGGASCGFESFAKHIVSFLNYKGVVGGHSVDCSIVLCTAAMGSIQQPNGQIEKSTEPLGSLIWINLGDETTEIHFLENSQSLSPSPGKVIRQIRIGIPPLHGIRLPSTLDLKGFDPLDQESGVFLQVSW